MQAYNYWQDQPGNYFEGGPPQKRGGAAQVEKRRPGANAQGRRRFSNVGCFRIEIRKEGSECDKRPPPEREAASFLWFFSVSVLGLDHDTKRRRTMRSTGFLEGDPLRQAMTDASSSTPAGEAGGAKRGCTDLRMNSSLCLPKRVKHTDSFKYRSAGKLALSLGKDWMGGEGPSRPRVPPAPEGGKGNAGLASGLRH